MHGGSGGNQGQRTRQYRRRHRQRPVECRRRAVHGSSPPGMNWFRIVHVGGAPIPDPIVVADGGEADDGAHRGEPRGHEQDDREAAREHVDGVLQLGAVEHLRQDVEASLGCGLANLLGCPIELVDVGGKDRAEDRDADGGAERERRVGGARGGTGTVGRGNR